MTYTPRMLAWAAAIALGAAPAAAAQQLASAARTPTPRDITTATGAPHAAPLELWQAAGDTVLTRLIADALEHNHDRKAAAARVHGARATRLRSALDLAPAITASGGYTRQRLASPMVPGAISSLPDQDLWDAGLRLAWEVDVFGRGRRSLQGHGEMVAATQEDERDVQILLVGEVARAYFALRGAQDRLAVARRNAENLRGTLEITLQRLEGGRGTALDSERAQAQLSATLAEIPVLEAEITAVRHRIAVLVVREPADLEPLLEARAPVVALPENIVVPSTESLVLRRPDVQSAARQVAASEAFVGAARADYLPRFAIQGAAGYTGTTLGSLGDGGTPRYALGPVISWPALDIGRVRAGVEAARAQEEEARVRYEQLLLRADEQIETALATYRGAVERLRHLEDAAAASERAAELARLRFAEGASDFLQVLDAERTLLEAQDRRAQGRTAASNALVDVYRSLGGAVPLAASGSR